MFTSIVEKIVGTKQDRDLKLFLPLLYQINELEKDMLALPDEAFPQKTEEFRRRLADGESTDAILPEAFALAREAARRTLGERPYDVQILGGLSLHRGNITEMKTGEGKTLSSVAPAYLNALTGKGVHIVTVNDYLAERDANWMKPVYAFLGITVGFIVSSMDPARRKESYEQDITFGTNNEFGFDYLRDNMAHSLEEKVQKNHHFCIIDEIDSILIDEARTPLIISGAVEEDTSKYKAVDGLVSFLQECEKDPETGDYPRDEMGQEILKGDYKLDEKNKRVVFTDEGMNKIEKILLNRGYIQGSLFEEENFEYIHYLTQAMKAHLLFDIDVDYVVQEGQVQIVDQFTGRVLQGRRYSDGLHQALEAKENIKVAHQNKTLATITFQNFFRMYDKISGMTGTAETEAKEFAKIYNLDVVVIPTNRPVVRDDRDDLIFLNEEFKHEAICDEIQEAHDRGQPILVGTVSIEKSEAISKVLRKRGIPHEVLNAKNHHREALIINEAGAKGSVTIATNMAGRGTDIKLGGNPATRARHKVGTDASEEEYQQAYEEAVIQWRKDYEEVKAQGGLYVIGTERHESRRIDNQLRGRSGRQGDPGKSQFFISLDDNLMRLFGGDNFRNAMGRLGMSGGEPIYHPLVNRALEKAQRRVEDRNFEIRKHLLEYDDVLNKQREYIYEQRDAILTNPALYKMVRETAGEMVDALLENYEESQRKEEKSVALAYLLERLKDNFFFEPPQTPEELLKLPGDTIKTQVLEALDKDLEEKRTLLGDEQLNMFLRYEYLRNIDIRWQNHLENLDELREAVSLRSYAQKNPLMEYKKEGFDIFDTLVEDIRIALARKLFKVRIREDAGEQRRNAAQKGRRGVQTRHRDINAFNVPRRQARGGGRNAGQNPGGAAVQVVRSSPKVGRNDPCPCGSGKKYKHCCGK